MTRENSFYSSKRGPKTDFTAVARSIDNWLPKLQRVATTEAGCLEWQGAKNGRGYGVLSAYQIAPGRAKLEYAHRLAFFAAKGAIPSNQVVDHKCRNPSCINPDHLRLLSHEENAKTARPEIKCRKCGGEKRRQPSGRMVCPPCASARSQRCKAKGANSDR